MRLLPIPILDYFFKTESGNYRPPQSEEEERLKNEARAKGINRKIKRYVILLEQGYGIPKNMIVNDVTLAEWMRHCKRSGLFKHGKILFENGGLNIANLTEENLVDVEEDYQVCVRMLRRSK